MQQLKMADLSPIQAQPGRQSDFVASAADITIYGGAAGSGKSYGLLIDPIRFFNIDGINAAIFRREREELNLPGSIWMESQKVYGDLGMRPNLTKMQYQFAKQSYLKFAGIQLERDKWKWQGAHLDFLGFDELTHFTSTQFWYLVARLRSGSGRVKPYCRATCNPKLGWVFDLLKWWIDEKTGYPIEERSGVLRWRYPIDDVEYWFNSEEEALKSLSAKGIDNSGDKKIHPLSVTFIPATLNDNQILLKNDPSYYSKLAQLPEDERLKLLEGRWLFRPVGKLFKPDWFGHFVIPPRDEEVILIATDTASSTKTANDFTCFQQWVRKDGRIYLIEEIHGKFTTKQQLILLINFILKTKAKYVSIERASSGFHLIDEIVQKTGVLLIERTRNKDKYTRGRDIQAYVEQGYVHVNPTAPYYAGFISEVAGFSPENKNKREMHDDRVDPFIDAVDILLVDNLDAVQAPIDYDTKVSYVSAGNV